ncbi:hypothetical protein C8R44DRAFT_864361 [Mycena epipterygia]|nr:hypothetical protein C8R44DRAFT_864361 [Mycena epipterygia]
MPEPNRSSGSAFGKKGPEPEPNRTLTTLSLAARGQGDEPLLGNLQCSALETLVSPILRIPPELLCHVFILALPRRTPTSPTIPVLGARILRGPWNLAGPWVFGQVCRHWRVLALSFPNLWTSIVASTSLWGRELPLLNIQLHRSGNAPLDLLIKFTSGQRSSMETFFDVFLATLIGHCGRWRTLQFEFDGACLPHRAFDALGEMPLLKELVFSGQDVPYLQNYDFFKDAPNLSRVVLSSRGARSIPNILLPWAQLTSYKATYSDGLKHFRNLSASAANLVIRHGDTLTLPRLRRLVITKDLFLECLVAPALQELHVHGTVDRVLPFLHNSGCVLQHLTLFMCTALDADVILILRNTPSISTLAVDFLGHAAATNAIISALTIPRGASDVEDICPNLTSLSWGDRNDMMNPASFVDMVESRWRGDRSGCRHLSFVGVYGGHLRMKTNGRRLRQFAEEGMDVVMLNARNRRGRQTMAEWREY